MLVLFNECQTFFAKRDLQYPLAQSIDNLPHGYNVKPL